MATKIISGDSTGPKDADEVITQSGFRITSRKKPILKANPIEEMTEKLGITPPEMIFGDNFIRIEHLSSGWGIEFNAFDALDLVDKSGSTMLKVSYSKEWQENRQHVHSDIKEVIKPFDWSYTTNYKGTLLSSTTSKDETSTETSTSISSSITTITTAAAAAAAAAITSSTSSIPTFQPTTTSLPLHLLARQDPILFFSETPIYEDELADNGISLLTTKVRVMPSRLLLLSRFFLRLDGVVFRVRDTRVYVEFATGQVVREYTAREDSYEAISRKLGGGADVPSLMREPDRLVGLLPVVDRSLESLELK